jgi:hypothetical protein
MSIAIPNGRFVVEYVGDKVWWFYYDGKYRIRLG